MITGKIGFFFIVDYVHTRCSFSAGDHTKTSLRTSKTRGNFVRTAHPIYQHTPFRHSTGKFAQEHGIGLGIRETDGMIQHNYIGRLPLCAVLETQAAHSLASQSMPQKGRKLAALPTSFFLSRMTRWGKEVKDIWMTTLSHSQLEEMGRTTVDCREVEEGHRTTTVKGSAWGEGYKQM